MKPGKDGLQIRATRANSRNGLCTAANLRLQDSALNAHTSLDSAFTAQRPLALSNLSVSIDSTDLLDETQRIGALGSYVLDIPAGLWKGSAFLYVLLGIESRCEKTLASWIEIIHPEDRAMMAEYFKTEVVGEGKPFDKEYRIVRAGDKAVRWVHGMGSLRFDAYGKPLKMRGVIRDITERKQAEEALRDSQEFALSTIDALSTTLCVLNESGAILAVNRSWREFAEANRKTPNDGFLPASEMHCHFNEQTNYLTLCDAVVGPEAVEAAAFAAGIRAVLRGESKQHSQEYECHSPNKKQWFIGKVTPFFANGLRRAVVEHIDITAIRQGEGLLQQASQRLGESEKRYRTAFQTSIDAMSLTRLADGKYLDANQALLDLVGYSRDEVIGRTSVEAGIWVDPNERSRMAEDVRRDSFMRDFEAQFWKKTGEVVWGLMSASAIEIEGVPCILSIIRDVTAAKAVEVRLASSSHALRLSEERYRTVFQTSIDSITIYRVDSQRFVDVNQAFLDVMGFERDEVIGRTPLEVRLWSDPRDLEDLTEALTRTSECRNVEFKFRKKNGDTIWGLMSASMIQIDGVLCMLTITRDVSNAKAAEDQIHNLAFFDPLTGLPNRRLLLDRLNRPLAIGTRAGRLRALLLIDLDNFKSLNDTLGHQTGDLLLQEAARRLADCARDADTAGRLGGDEFVLMLEDLSEIPEDAAAQAKAIGEKILATVGRPYLLHGSECRASASIGISVFENRRECSNQALQQADIAMDQAKAAGRNTMRFFAPALQAAVNARAAMESELRQAIEAKQFVLFYQAQIDGSRLIGAEALIRWNHPCRKLLPPGEFIHLAEETGLILPLGKWVLEAACKQISAWANRPQTTRLSISVNISARQFRQPDFVEQVLTVLDQTGANPRKLELELTESMLAENVDEIIKKMKELKSHGLRFSLDDFGTGYSSLTYLKRLPLDQLKIDRSFIRDIESDGSSAAIAQTIIALSRAMHMPVIAEGVETEQQREFLTHLGCHTFQGYLFGRPLPLDEFENQWLSPAETPLLLAS